MSQTKPPAPKVSQVSGMKVALVHDWLVGGGAERVLLELHKMFPEAPIYTSYATEQWRDKLNGKVVTGYLQHWPFSKLRRFIPMLRARWFRKLDLSSYDLIISSKGNGEANYITKPEGAKHVCYCHSPTHFYWRHYDQYLKNPGFGFLNPVVRLGLKVLVEPLRKHDHQAAQKVDYFIANSSHIQADIKEYYARDSVVIHPPVDTARFTTTSSSERKGFITVGRQVPHKHTEIIIEACNQLGLPLKVIGRGPEHRRLANIAGFTVTMLSRVSDDELPSHMAEAEAFLFASYEDFGITPVEAMAAGTPVIAYKAGGALDYVNPGQSGEFFTEQSVASLASTLSKFDPNKYNSTTISKQSQAFSTEQFSQNLTDFISQLNQTNA